jgi:hypothetical protein
VTPSGKTVSISPVIARARRADEDVEAGLVTAIEPSSRPGSGSSFASRACHHWTAVSGLPRDEDAREVLVLGHAEHVAVAGHVQMTHG